MEKDALQLMVQGVTNMRDRIAELEAQQVALRQRAEAAEARVEGYRMALQFYADPANWVEEWNGQGFTIIDFDEGATAQAALKA